MRYQSEACHASDFASHERMCKYKMLLKCSLRLKHPQSSGILDDMDAWIGRNTHMLEPTAHRVYPGGLSVDQFLENGLMLHFLHDRSKVDLFERMELKMAVMVDGSWCVKISGMVNVPRIRKIWEIEEKKYQAKFKDDFIALACFVVAVTEIDPTIPAQSMIRFREDSIWYYMPFFVVMTHSARLAMASSNDWQRDLMEHSALLTRSVSYVIAV